MKFLRALAGALVGLGLLSGLLLLAPTAQAASGSVSVAAPAFSAAIDESSNGVVVTPKVRARGKAKITSRSYMITDGGTTLAKTSVAGKRVALPIGAYSVKVTVKYKVGKKKKTTTKSFAVRIVNSSRMSLDEYNAIAPGQTAAEVAAMVGGWGAIDTEWRSQDCDYDDDFNATCRDVVHQGRKWRTASEYGFGYVWFTNGRVDADYYKSYYK